MKKILKTITCLVFYGMILFFQTAMADSDFDSWKQEFYQQALKKGVSKKVLDQALPKMELLERVVALDTRKPEYVANFYDYTKSRLSDTRIQKGRQMAQKYKTWLKRVEQKYGVQQEYLLALWGMETNYGDFMGSVDMLSSLASLAYHPRRRSFFTNELIAYLKIVQKESSVAPQLGSWDGGFGHFQFMPTTFMAYAVDGDGNGRRDIVHNMPDAFSSAANYLSSMGWHGNEVWGREVLLPQNPNWDIIYNHEVKPVSEWQKLGFLPKHLKAFPDSELLILAELRMPMGHQGPIFLTYPNFKLIMRWNKSEFYALSAGLLADSISQKSKCHKPSADFKPFKTTQIMCMQDKLREQGHFTHGSDGLIGSKTKKAVRSYQQKHHLIPDGYPNQEILEKMECYYDEQ